MKKVNVLKNQTVMDLAIMYYGKREAVFDIIEDNNTLRNDFPDTFAGDESNFNFALPVAEGLQVSIREEGDNIDNNILRQMVNDVTSHKVDVAIPGEKEPYLADNNLNYITDEEGNYIFIPNFN